MLWLDFFALDLHVPPTDPGRAVADVAGVVRTCQSSLFVLDEDGMALTRAWMLYEAWVAITETHGLAQGGSSQAAGGAHLGDHPSVAAVAAALTAPAPAVNVGEAQAGAGAGKAGQQVGPGKLVVLAHGVAHNNLLAEAFAAMEVGGGEVGSIGMVDISNQTIRAH